MLWFKQEQYPSYRQLIDMGYSKDEAWNILDMVKAGANDPQMVWKLARDNAPKAK